MNKYILLIGPNGFLATHLLPKLLRMPNASIIGLGRHQPAQNDLHAFYTDQDQLKKDYPDIDLIYLLASHIPYGSFKTASTALVESNIQLVAKLSLAYPAARIIFSSSVSVYGNSAGVPIGIKSPFVDPDLYGLSKLAGEAIVRNHSSFAILRYSSIIGRGMNSNTMVPKMIKASKEGKIVIWGNGQRLQNYIDVRDAAQMCLQAADSKQSFIALGVGERSYSNTEVAEHLQLLTQATLVYSGDDASPSFVYDTEESYALLNFRPQFTLEQSLNDIVR